MAPPSSTWHSLARSTLWLALMVARISLYRIFPTSSPICLGEVGSPWRFRVRTLHAARTATRLWTFWLASSMAPKHSYMVLSMFAVLYGAVIVCSATCWSQCVQFHRVLSMNAVPYSSVNICSDTYCSYVFCSKKYCQSLQCLFCFQCFQFHIMLSVSLVQHSWHCFSPSYQRSSVCLLPAAYIIFGQVPANNSLLEVQFSQGCFIFPRYLTTMWSLVLPSYSGGSG